YGIGGYLLYGRTGAWRFYQPGVGGVRFVALNGIVWSLYAFSLGTSLLSYVHHSDSVLRILSLTTGLLAYGMMVAALLTYRNGAAVTKREQPPPTPIASLEAPSDAT